MEGLKENVDLLDHLLEGETKVSKLLTDLKYEKIETLHIIMVLESKLMKLKYHLNELIELKIRFSNLSLSYCKSKLKLKTVFL